MISFFCSAVLCIALPFPVVASSAGIARFLSSVQQYKSLRNSERLCEKKENHYPVCFTCLWLGFYFWGYNILYFSQQDGVPNIVVETDLMNRNPHLFGTRCESYTSPNFSISFSLFRVDIVTKAHIVLGCRWVTNIHKLKLFPPHSKTSTNIVYLCHCFQ